MIKEEKVFQKWYKDGYIIIALASAIVGLILFFVTESIPNGSLKNIVSNLASTLFIAGSFAAISELILTDKLVNLIFSKLKLKENIDNTGLEEVYYGLHEIDYRFYLKKATKNIDVVHIYGRTWTNTYIDDIKDKILNSNCSVRVILLSPESQFVSALAEYYGITAEELKGRIIESTKIWKEMYCKVEGRGKRRTMGNLSLYYHSGQPTNPLYRIDERVVCVLDKITKGKTTKLPSIIFRKTSKKEDIYNSYIEEIDQLVVESQRVELKEAVGGRTA